MDSEKTIKLKANDGTVLELGSIAASKSGLLAGVIQDYPENSEFPLNNVDGKTLKKVKEYLEHYADKEPTPIERPLKSVDFKQCVDEWDYNYLGDDYDEIFALVLASNYMDIKPLQELASAKIGSTIKNITTEAIRKDFEITGKFTKEEEEQILRDKAYLEQSL